MRLLKIQHVLLLLIMQLELNVFKATNVISSGHFLNNPTSGLQQILRDVMEYCIQLATDKDKASLLLMMKEHATFEGHHLELSKNQQHCKIENLPITLFVVYSNNKLVGYMSVIKQFSTWDMDWYLYLDCLYLTKETRGKGVGVSLMNKLKAFAKEKMIKTIQWQTPKDNLLAIEFYLNLGAIKKEKQRFFWSI